MKTTERLLSETKEIWAAILSCAYSYEVIVRKIVECNPTAIDCPFYRDWIRS